MQNINLRDAFYCKKQLDLGLIILSLTYLLEIKYHTIRTLGEDFRYAIIGGTCCHLIDSSSCHTLELRTYKSVWKLAS